MAPFENNPKGQLNRLHLLARFYRVQTDYWDIFGHRRWASPEALISILRVLGAAINDIKDASDAVRERRQSLWRRPIEPVLLAWDGAASSFKLRLPSDLTQGSIDYEIALENGESRTGEVQQESLRAAETEVEGVRYSTLRIGIPDRLPYGYHPLTLAVGKNRYQSLIISSPWQAYRPPEEKPRQWGLFLPLYALQSEESWGAGDFSDLEKLMDWSRELGGGIIGTLPLLASFLDEPFDPSPYSPVSRLFWNEFYVDVTRVPELEQCGPARNLLNSTDFRKQLETFRSSSTVDYRAQMALKRKIMELLARCLFGTESERRASLLRFLQSHPALEDYAQFRAMTEKQKKIWSEWPEPSRNGVLNTADYDEAAKQYHLYVQWLAHEQLAALADKARYVGPALYLDFPLGVHQDGYDVWRERSSFALGSSGGAPPDDFFVKGQNWGFPPLHPEQLRNQRYRYYIASLRHHLSQARLLRIDHVMGLHRLFWIADGQAPSEGVYVRYPAEEFYAILSLESHRHKTVIVGENLGTVPPHVNEAMNKHGIFGLSVAQFKINADAQRALGEFPAHSVTSMNTHDTATFAGYWNGLDIEERVKLGLLEKAAAATDRERREQAKQALVVFLRNHGLLENNNADLPSVVKACLLCLGATER